MFISATNKNKKTFFGVIFLLFVFLSVIGLSTPRTASAAQSADSWWCPPTSPWYMICAGNDLYNAATGQSTSVGNKLWETIKSPVADSGKFLLEAIVFGLTFLGVMMFGTLANIMGGLFLWILSAGQTISYTHISGPDMNPAVAAGWPRVRDLANMVVVLGFVVVGIATTLRIQDYQAKKLLPKLIIAALLINFSLVITGIFIDGSNIIISSFGNAGGYLNRGWTDNVWKSVETLWNNFDINNATKFIGIAVGIVFQSIMLFIIYTLFFFLYLFRYIALWILVILSPLAFVFSVFPYTKKFFDMWLSQFVQWCIIGIPAAFFLWLSDSISSGMIASTTNTSTVGGTTLSFMAYLIPGFFLLAGFFFSLQTSAMGAGIAVKLGKGTAKFASLNALRGLAGATNADRAGNWIKNKATAVGERLNLVNKGTAAGMEAKRLEEPKKRLNNLGSDRLAQIASQSAWTKTKSEDKAAATQLLADRGDLYDIKNERERSAAVAHASSFPGVKRSDFEKVDPTMAKYNTVKVKEKMKQIDPHTGFNYTEAGAKLDLTREAYEKVDVPAIRKMPKQAFNLDFVKSIGAQRLQRAGIEMTQEKIEELKKFVSLDATGNPTPEMQSAINERNNLLAAGRIKEADKIRDNMLVIRNL